MSRAIAVTWDYRCPFARNAHEAVITALREGADLDVWFLPFSLDQVHVEEGETPVWERPPEDRGTGVLSLQWGLAVRDSFAERFFDFHLATFAARFDEGRKIGKESVLREIAGEVGLDVDAVAEEVAGGHPLKTLVKEHTEAVDRWSVFGVPTFIEGDEAAFVRFMDRNRADDLQRALDLIGWSRLNEFKRTTIPR
ncbi:MAG TPA: DsbA family protein [Acidimicrobiia bacterium]